MVNNNNTAQQQQAGYEHADPVYSYIEGEAIEEGSRRRPGLKMLGLFVVVGGLLGLALFSYNQGRKERMADATATIEPESPYVRQQPTEADNAELPTENNEVYNTMDSAASEGGLRSLPTAVPPVAGEESAGTTSYVTGNGGSTTAQAKKDEKAANAPGGLLPSQIVGQVGNAPAASAPVSLGAPMALAPNAATTNTTAADVAAATSRYTAPMRELPPVATPVLTPKVVSALPTKSVPASPVAVAVNTPKAVVPVRPIAPAASAPVSSGTVKIQLAAVKERAAAEKAWRDLSGRYGSVLQGMRPVYQSVTLPGTGTVYRLQAAGFSSVQAATSACNQLKSSGQGCYLVK
jgi:hypothetical protein